MTWSFQRVWGAGIVAACALLSPPTRADGGIKERIPVSWDDSACMHFVDRSVNPIHEFTYSIAEEDPRPGETILPEEVSDSRRHQFFAVCQQRNLSELPPAWISQDDVAAALAKDLIGEHTVEPSTDVLEANPLWHGCFHRINADDDRWPISFDAAAEPVQWDTTGVPEGTYHLWGYTWEPPFNHWAPRRGVVVNVFDGGDPAERGPSGAITTEEIVVYAEESARVEGCAHGLPGTTARGYVLHIPEHGPAGWTPPWVPFSEPVEVTDGTFSLDFVPSADLGGQILLVRVDVTDPEGRTYAAHMVKVATVLPVPDDCGGSFIGSQSCTTGDEGSDETTGEVPSTTTGSEGPSSGGAPQASDEAGAGGWCAVGRPGSPWGALLMFVLLGLRRRVGPRRPV